LAYERRARVEGGRGNDHPLDWSDATEDDVLVRRLRGNLTARQDPFRASFHNDAVAEALQATIEEWRPDLVHLISGYLMTASVVRTARRHQLPVVVSLTDYWWHCHRVNLLKPDGRRCEGPSPAGCARCAWEVKRRWRMPAVLWPRGADVLWNVVPRLPTLAQSSVLGAQRHRNEMLSSTLAEVDALIAPSRFLADFYIRHGAEPGKMHVHRQGVERPRHPGRAPAEELRVSYAGQVKAHKGVDLLLTAWSRLVGTRRKTLELFGSAIGEDVYRRRIERMIAGLPDARWAGEYTADEAWDMLSRTDVLVVPSRWVENSPNIILEAQAMNVPVVGSNLGGIAELVAHDRDGLLFEVDDAVDLARQLQRLLDEVDLQPRLSRAAPSVRSVLDELDDLVRVYNSLMAV
jgi:glycosyltransferase involved in cell wall biosynthesis